MSSAFGDDRTREVGIEPRRWELPRSYLLRSLAFALLFVVVGVAVTFGFWSGDALGDFGPLVVVFFVVWWAGLISGAVAWLRTANRIDLYPDGSLVISAPVRAVHMHAQRLRRLRYARGNNDNRQPGFVLDGDGRSVRLPRQLVDRELMGALRAGSPGMDLPEPWW